MTRVSPSFRGRVAAGAATAITLLLLLTATLVLGGCSRTARAERQFAGGRADFARGEFDRAEIELLNALRLDPTHAGATRTLGTIYARQGRIVRALQTLARARDLAPEDPEVRVELGRLVLALGQVEDARAGAIFALDRAPHSREAPVLLAEASHQPADIAASRLRLEALAARDPRSAPVSVGLAILDLREQRLADAARRLEEALALEPEYSVAHALRGSLYLMQHDNARAEPALATAARLGGPRSPESLQYARFRLGTGDREGARDYLRQIVAATPDYLPAAMSLAEVAFAEQDFTECGAILEKIRAREATHPDALLLTGRLKLVRGDAAGAITDLERLASAFTRSVGVQQALASAYLANQQPRQAAAALNQVLTLAPNSVEATLLLAATRVQLGETTPAISALQGLLRTRPDLARARLLLAQALLRAGNPAAALVESRRLATEAPTDVQYPFLSALILLQQGNAREARGELERTLQLDPDHSGALEQLVNLDLREQRVTEARSRLEAEMDRTPDRATPRLLLARVLLSQSEFTGAEAALRRVIALEPQNSAAYLLLARVQLATSDPEAALENLEAARARNPRDVPTLMLLGIVRDQRREWAAARDAYEAAIAVNPRLAPALNNLAYLYSEHFPQPDRAYELATRARQLTPNDPATGDTLGYALYLKGEYAWALNLLRDSAAKLATHGEAQYHLGLALYMMGEEPAARAALARALELDPALPAAPEIQRRLAILDLDPAKASPTALAELEKTTAARPDPVALARLAAIRERRGDYAAAAQAAEAAIKANPQNARAHMLLARLEADRLGRLPQAIERANAAYKLNPDDPAIVTLLGRLARRSGDAERARAVLHAATRQPQATADTWFEFALAAFDTGRVDEAAAAAQAALSHDPQSAAAPAAQRLLELVTIYAGSHRDAQSAAIVAAALQAEPESLPAQLAAAALLEQPDSASASALAAYAKIVEGRPGFAPAASRLARLYAQMPSPDADTGLRHARRAREAYPGDPEVALSLGILLYRKGEFSWAANVLREASLARRDDPTAWLHLGLALHRLGNRTEARPALERALTLGVTGPMADEVNRALAEMRAGT